MRFLVDAQLPPALARWFSDQGHESEHVHDLGLAAASDRDIWLYAGKTGSALVLPGIKWKACNEIYRVG